MGHIMIVVTRTRQGGNERVTGDGAGGHGPGAPARISMPFWRLCRFPPPHRQRTHPVPPAHSDGSSRGRPEGAATSNAVYELKQCLQKLVGSGFVLSLTVDDASFSGLKVVVIVDDLLYTVTNTGAVNVFPIPSIRRIDY